MDEFPFESPTERSSRCELNLYGGEARVRNKSVCLPPPGNPGELRPAQRCTGFPVRRINNRVRSHSGRCVLDDRLSCPDEPHILPWDACPHRRYRWESTPPNCSRCDTRPDGPMLTRQQRGTCPPGPG